MNYSECISYLFSQLPVYHRVGPAAYKPGIGNITHLCEQLGNPEKELKFVHIAGTNGKGSTSHLIASTLQEAGYKTGLYTSPHLLDFRERIRIDGAMIPKEAVTEFVVSNKEKWKDIRPSFFEISVALALWHFQVEKTDIIVMEVGLGGRLDSTNIIHPELSVITQIGMDHMNLLGNTIPLIAAEKAGIIKPGVPVVIGDLHPEAEKVIRDKASETNSALYRTSSEFTPYPTPLLGNYQVQNSRTAQLALKVMREERQWKIRDEHVARGFDRVVENTGLMGRWQILSHRPMTICDVAHNEDGIREIAKQIESMDFDRLHFVLGTVNDKDIGRMLALLPKDATYYFCKANIPRGLDAQILSMMANEAGLFGAIYKSVPDAYESARKSARENDLVFIGGSFFTVAEVLQTDNSY